MRVVRVALCCSALALLTGASVYAADAAPSKILRLDPRTMRQIAKVDPRFLSYNVEMVEVTGGVFWKPYPTEGQASAQNRVAPLKPLDLKENTRLRVLAAALGPAYVRVGGAWANMTYFQDNEDAPLKTPPKGFIGVLTRAQWASVVDFARATDSKIVTSFAVTSGTRDAAGVWMPDQARSLISYTRSIGGSIYAAAFANEPNSGPLNGRGYDAAAYARDLAMYDRFLKSEAPEIKTVGPTSTSNEAGYRLVANANPAFRTEALLAAEPRTKLDIFAHNFYGAPSERCAKEGPELLTSPAQGLSEQWLSRADTVNDFYRALRDRFSPGAPIWITESGQAACGGDRWAANFIDTFRFVDQLGRMAKRNVQVVFHNTLAARDYALIDDGTWTPRPSYWAAVLWKRLMGNTVLDAGPGRSDLHLYAHCLRGKSGGVGLVAINLNKRQRAALHISAGAQRYTLTGHDLLDKIIQLNSKSLALTADEQLPALDAVRARKGRVTLAPASINFFAFPDAGNPMCVASG